MKFKINYLKVEMERIWNDWSCMNACHLTRWLTLGNPRGLLTPKKGRLTYPKLEPLKSLRKRLGLS
jgi:hypothetical protein